MYSQLFLVQAEPLQSSTIEVPCAPPLDALRRGRQDYAKLLMDKMRAPDGSYEEGFIIPGLGTSPARIDRSGEDLERNNPLSLHDEVRIVHYSIITQIITILRIS